MVMLVPSDKAEALMLTAMLASAKSTLVKVTTNMPPAKLMAVGPRPRR